LKFDGKATGKLFVSGNVPAGTRFTVHSTAPGALDFSSRFDEHLLTSCLTFVDATLDAAVIDSVNAACEDGVNFLRVSGSVASLTVSRAAADAIDADFSTLRFDAIEVADAGNDCVDLSMGEYAIARFSGERCGDKGVSVGEQAQASIDSATVQTAISGIVAKDSAVLSIGDVHIDDVSFCFQVYRKKQEFDGALIKATDAMNVSCNADSRVQAGSELRLD
jgi:hypothetical protein